MRLSTILILCCTALLSACQANPQGGQTEVYGSVGVSSGISQHNNIGVSGSL